jgi:hypothetical protein
MKPSCPLTRPLANGAIAKLQASILRTSSLEPKKLDQPLDRKLNICRC